MSRFRLLVLLIATAVLGSCNIYTDDDDLRQWATRVDVHFDSIYNWQSKTVFPGLEAICQLERIVLDRFHKADVPNLPTKPVRYCPEAGGGDPVNPPQPPPEWDD